MRARWFVQALAVFLFFVPFSFAIGVSPPLAEINWVPGMEGEFDILLMNSRDIPVEVEFSASGDLAQYFSATTPVIPARGRVSATVSFSLPQEISPGFHRQQLHFTEDFPEIATSGVSAKTSVTLITKVFRPYPGKYADLSLDVNNVKKGENAYLEFFIASRGTDTVFGDLEVHVKDLEDRLVDTLIEADLSIEGNTDFDRTVVLQSSEYDPGKYYLQGRFDYGAGIAEGTAELIVGTKTVLINDVTRTFYKDAGVTKFEVQVESLWNEQLDGVFATFQLGTQSGQSPSVALAPFSKSTLVGYWETDESLAEGEHTALVHVQFGPTEVVSVPFTVSVFESTPAPVVETPAPVEEEESVVILGLADVLFILLCVGILGYLLIHTIRKHSRK